MKLLEICCFIWEKNWNENEKSKIIKLENKKTIIQGNLNLKLVKYLIFRNKFSCKWK